MSDYYTEAVRTWQQSDKNLKHFADGIKAETGFNVFMNSEFAEYYFAEILGGVTTSSRSNCDIVLSNGTRIEVKFSKPIQDKKIWSNHPVYFCWNKLFGLNNAKIGKVDYLILSGYFEDRYYIWVIPYQEVKKNTAEITIADRNSQSNNWINPYFVGDEYDLKSYFANR